MSDQGGVQRWAATRLVMDLGGLCGAWVVLLPVVLQQAFFGTEMEDKCDQGNPLAWSVLVISAWAVGAALFWNGFWPSGRAAASPLRRHAWGLAVSLGLTVLLYGAWWGWSWAHGLGVGWFDRERVVLLVFSPALALLASSTVFLAERRSVWGTFRALLVSSAAAQGAASLASGVADRTAFLSAELAWLSVLPLLLLLVWPWAQARGTPAAQLGAWTATAFLTSVGLGAAALWLPQPWGRFTMPAVFLVSAACWLLGAVVLLRQDSRFIAPQSAS